MKKNLRDIPERTKISLENLEIAGIPSEFWLTKLDDLVLHDDIESAVKSYIFDLPANYVVGQGLFLLGSNGTGKSHIASIILQIAYKKRFTIRYTTLNSLVPLGVKSGYSEDAEEMYYEFLKADFLVIDEIGKEQEGEKRANVTILEEVLRYRNMKELPTILITNLQIEDFSERYGKSIISLIMQRFMDITISGEDFRKKQYKSKLKGLSK